jgi:hypothetical protein
MNEVKIERDGLLAVVEDNRAKHRDLFERAWAGYREAVEAWFSEQLDRISEGNDPALHCPLSIPQDHTSDYDKLVTMLKMSVDSHVTLQRDEFSRYVMDNWRWKQEFLATSIGYVGELGEMPTGGS